MPIGTLDELGPEKDHPARNPRINGFFATRGPKGLESPPSLVLDHLFVPDATGLPDGPLALLDWRSGFSPFVGRDTELERLEAWAEDEAPLSGLFLIGEGGSGKARLAAEVARRLHARGWAAGFARLDCAFAVSTHQAGTLIILEAPEEHHDALSMLMLELSQNTSPASRVRILFLTREPSIHWRTNVASLSIAEDIPFDTVGPLAPLSTDAASTLLEDTLHAVWAKLERDGTPPRVDPGSRSEWLDAAEVNRMPLAVVCMAVLAALEPETAPYCGHFAETANRLIALSVAHARETSTSLGMAPGDLPRALATATLAGGLAWDRIANPSWDSPDVDLTAVANAWEPLQDAGYGDGAQLLPLAPRVLAAGFAAEAAAQDAQSVPGLWAWKAMETGSRDGIARLLRLTRDATGLLDRPDGNFFATLAPATLAPRGLLLDFTESLFPFGRHNAGGLPDEVRNTAIEAGKATLALLEKDAHRGTMSNNLSAWLREDGRHEEALAMIRLSADLYSELARRDRWKYGADCALTLHSLSVQLGEAGAPEEAVTIEQRALDDYRWLERRNPDKFRFEIADSSFTLSRHLSALGRIDESLEALQHAIAAYEWLASREPERFEPDLATCLNDYCVRLREAGRNEEATVAIQRALEIRERLAVDYPGWEQASFATVLQNLAHQHQHAGRIEDAVQAMVRAVDIRRILAERNPGYFGPLVASGLAYLSRLQGKAGHEDDALASARESADRYRALNDDPNLEPCPENLARSLTEYSALLKAAGRLSDAVAPGEEAVAILERLYANDPEAYGPLLGGALDELALLLDKVGELGPSLAHAGRAVEVYGPLAERQPARFDPSLARAFHCLSIQLDRLGSDDEAMRVMDRAIAIRRRLAEANPELHGADLAASLMNMAAMLSRADLREDALEASVGAVEIMGPLADAAPDTHAPYMAFALNNLGNAYAAVRRKEEAVASFLRAIDIRERLAAQTPETHEPELALTLYSVALHLDELGRYDEALAPIEKSISIRHRLAQDDPDQFKADLARSLMIKAYVLAHQIHIDESIATFERAIDLLRQHIAASPDDSRARGTLDHIEKVLDQLVGQYPR